MQNNKDLQVNDKDENVTVSSSAKQNESKISRAPENPMGTAPVNKIRTPENPMGTAPVNKILLQMAWPAILSMTINALYNVVDSVFVGMLSEEALTAVSIINPIQILIIAVAIGSGIGINSLIARRLGAHRQREADQAASTGIIIAFFNAALWVIFAAFFAEDFVHIYYQDGYIAEAAISYLRVNCFLSLFINIQCIVEKTLQATGNMKAPMFISLSGAVTNLVLDPLFIFGIGFFPELGVTGAAIATVAGQFVAMNVGLIVLFKGEHRVEIKLKGFKMDWKILREIYSVAIPTIIMQSITSLMIVCYNGILATFSQSAVAVLGVYFKLQSFIFMPVFGLMQGAMPLMGFNYGARNKERLLETRKRGLLLAVLFMVVGLLLFQLFPEFLLGLFSAGEGMLEVGVPALRIISLNFIPAAYGIMTATLFQATGHGVYSLFSSLIRQLVCIIPLAYILASIGGVTLSWFSFPLAELAGVIYTFMMFRYLKKKEIDTM